MAICNSVQNIAASECIGDSLVKINNNFSNLNLDLCTLLTIVNTLSSQVMANSSITGIPTGAIQAFAMANAPTGWLICNGVAVPNGSGTVQGQAANFSALYSLLGTTYGPVGTLPDLRGYFIRGWGTNSDGTTSGTFGEKQADSLKSHTHTGVAAAAGAHNHTVSGATQDPGGGSGGGSSADTVTRTTSTAGSHIHALTIDAAGGIETRPKNIALLYCIKY